MRRPGAKFEIVTADNGAEFHDYERAERLNLPKGESMAGLTRHRCDAIARRLNTRPRKRLGFGTPLECYNES